MNVAVADRQAGDPSGLGPIDRSFAARRRFRKWLAERYNKDVEALRWAWDDPQVTFASAEPPAPKARRATEHLFFRDARDVAVLADEEKSFHLRMGVTALTRPLGRELRAKLATMGKPFDLYLLSDVANSHMPDYRLYLFLNPYYLSDAVRAAIKAKARRNRAVSVWFYASGCVRPDGTSSAASGSRGHRGRLRRTSGGLVKPAAGAKPV